MGMGFLFGVMKNVLKFIGDSSCTTLNILKLIEFYTLKKRNFMTSEILVKLLKLHVWCICIAYELSKLSFETVEERNVMNSSDICWKGFKIKWNIKPQGFFFFFFKTQEREHSILNQEHSLHVIISYWHIMHFKLLLF